MPNHDCCLLGHNQANPTHASHLSPPQVADLPKLVPVLLVRASERRHEPALSSFDPPRTILPLRI
jgi:hypothetical protein